MAIRNVNGTNVYTIDTDVAKATDSRGKGYGSLYSDLRWEVWRETQAAALAKLNNSQAMYDAAKASIDKQISEQRKMINDMVLGNIEAGEAIAKSNANFSSEMVRAQASQRFTTSFGTTSERLGGPVEVGLEPKDKQNYVDAITAAKRAALVNGPPKSEEDVKRLIDESVKAIDSIETGPGLSPNQKALGQREAMREILDYAQQLSPEAANSAVQSINDKRPEWIENYTQKPEQPGMTSGSSQSFGEPAFLLTDERRNALTPTLELDSIGRQTELDRLKAELAALENSRDSLVAPVYDPLQAARTEFASKMGVGGFGIEGRKKQETPIFNQNKAVSAVTVVTDDIVNRFVAAQKKKVEDDVAGPPWNPVMEAGAKKAAVDLATDFILGKITKEQLSKIIEDADIRMTIPDELPLKQPQPPSKFPGLKPIPGDMVGPDGTIFVDKKLPEAPAPAELPTRKEKEADYAATVAMNAAKLASKPKKFERIAKTNLPASDRKSKVSDHVLLTEQLYKANMNSTDPVKSTYDELNKVYVNEPAKRKQAQEYLIAYDMLADKVNKPV